MKALGIETAGQLRDMQLKQARGIGTVVLERLVAELNGVPADAVEVIAPRRKGMAVTRSFGRPIATKHELMGAVTQFAMRAGDKLRQHGLVAGRLTAFFHTNRFKPERPQYSAGKAVTLHPLTSDSFELTRFMPDIKFMLADGDMGRLEEQASLSSALSTFLRCL